MYQPLALNPLFIQSIEDDFDEDKLDDLFYRLLKEIFLVDKSGYLENEYLDIYENILDEDVKYYLKKIMRRIKTEKNSKIIDITFEKRLPKDWSKLKYEFELVSKIIESQQIILTDSETQLYHNFNNTNRNVEIAAPLNYLNPTETSRIRLSDLNMTKERGDYFDLINWLYKYISDAKKIKIFDGYLQSHRAFNNLKKLFDIINSNTTIEVITMSDKARCTLYDYKNKKEIIKDDNINIDNKIKEIAKKYHLKKFELILIDKKFDINDRKITTDKFFIKLGHALDAIDNKNKVKKQFDIAVSRITSKL